MIDVQVPEWLGSDSTCRRLGLGFASPRLRRPSTAEARRASIFVFYLALTISMHRTALTIWRRIFP